MTPLTISISPRTTWLWAPDDAAVQRVRTLLGDACWPARRGRDQLSLVLDVGIGVEAMTACETLADDGFTFTWHESVRPLDRDGWPTTLPGMTPQPSTGDPPLDGVLRFEARPSEPGGVDLGGGVRLGLSMAAAITAR